MSSAWWWCAQAGAMAWRAVEVLRAHGGLWGAVAGCLPEAAQRSLLLGAPDLDGEKISALRLFPGLIGAENQCFQDPAAAGQGAHGSRTRHSLTPCMIRHVTRYGRTFIG